MLEKPFPIPAFTNASEMNHFRRAMPHAQETLYAFFLDAVKNWPPENVLAEFRSIFMHQAQSTTSSIAPALYQILFANQESEFHNTLKRSCYILINNWEIAREYAAIQQLVQLFSDPVLHKTTVSPTLRRLRKWVRHFAASPDFEELKLFVARYDDRGTAHWTHRYTSYLLVSQFVNLDNPNEQRQAAKHLHRKLREKFKFDLAMYTAHGHPSMLSERQQKNPTYLGDETLSLIKRILLKRGFFSYPNLARIFLTQIQDLKYSDFKQSLLEYLIFSIASTGLSIPLREQIANKLKTLYEDHQDDPINSGLLLRTVNRLIEFLLTETRQEPSPVFIALMSNGNILTLVVLLLKLIMICPYTRTHLEMRIADLIRFYENRPEDECKWMIHFLEVFNVAMTIHTENTEYSLVQMGKYYGHRNANSKLDDYRIFSQLKYRTSVLEADLMELAAIESLQEEAS